MNPSALALHAVVDNPLAKLELARRLLAETRSVDEVKMIRNLGEAARVYARQARLGLEAQNDAAEIKLRAERRLGELLAMLPTATGPLRTSGSSSRLPWSFANPTTRADHRYGP